MTALLSLIDQYVAPIIIAANRLRQARDALPPWIWRMVPATLRGPVNAIFGAVEEYERQIGRLIDAGVMPRPGDPSRR